MNEVVINGALAFSKVDCPTRVGELVDRVEDIYLIQNARMGMLVYAKETRETYIIRKLKEAVINGVVVENAAVAEFEIFKDEAVMKQYVLDAIDDDKYYAHDIELKVGALLENGEPADVKEFAYTMMIDKPFKIEVNGEYYIRQFKTMDLNGKVVEFVGELEETVLHADEVGYLYQVAFVHKDLFEAPFSQEELAQVVKFFGIKKEIPLVGYLGYYNSWEEFNEKLNSFTEAGYWHANVGRQKVIVYNYTAGNMPTQVVSGLLKVENGVLTGLIADYTSYKRMKMVGWGAWTLANKVSINSVVEVEKLRAEQAETDIAMRLALEEERAVAAEESLEKNITAEANRAMKMEQDIVDRINNLIIGNIPGLEGLDFSDYAKKTELQKAVAAEKERAEQAEQNISEAVVQNATAITAEKDRAIQAEQNLQEQINNIPTVDLSDYVQNAVLNQALTSLNTIKPRFGAVENDGSVVPGVTYCANIILTGSGEIATNDGYHISVVARFDKQGNIEEYITNQQLTKLTLDADYTYLLEFVRDDNEPFVKPLLDKVIKTLTFDTIRWGSSNNLNTYQGNGEYYIQGSRASTANDNMPILNGGDIEGTLKVIADSVSKNAMQILTLLNVGGGDGNIYTRTFNGGKWGEWQELGGKSSELLEPSEWAGKLNSLSKGVYEFYGSCTSLSNDSKSVWEWADGYRYDPGDPVYLKMIIGNKPIVQVIGAAGSATKQLNINDGTVG